MGQFEGKRVLITGAAGGIGLSTAREFAKQGAELIITDINPQALQTAKASLTAEGARVSAHQIDVTDQKAVEKLAEHTGFVDVLINNAGLGLQSELKDTTLSAWKKQMDINFWGPIYHIYAFLPAMEERRSGQIVNVSSGQAFIGTPTWGAYSVAKTAVGMFSEILHYEVKQHGIDVTTVYPYAVDTGFYDVATEGNFFQRLMMRMIPYLAITPEQAAERIYQSVLKKARNEDTHFITTAARWLQAIPILDWLVHTAAVAFLTDGRQTGFSIDEVMSGQHEFESGAGPEGKHPMHFKATWGPRNIIDWLNPTGDGFMTNDLEGTVTVHGLCEDAPCIGRLELRYFQEQKIRYIFDFKVKGKDYHYVGEKVDIKPWNLHVSHTTCFGELREVKTNKLISKSITYFHFNTIPEFIGSFRMKESALN